MRVLGRAAFCLMTALLLASCGPDPIVGKWIPLGGGGLVFNQNGSCASLIRKGAAFTCHWKALGGRQYDIVLEGDMGPMDGTMHIQGNKLVISTKRGLMVIGIRQTHD